MSTDLEFRHGLPVIRLRPAAEEVDTQRPTKIEEQQDNNNNNEAIQNSVNHSNYAQRIDDEDEGCRTPTSDEHKIGVMRSCPPAPRKQRRVILCKRKLSDEFKFFEFTGRDEVESFFRSSFNVKKRRCSISNSNSNSKSG